MLVAGFAMTGHLFAGWQAPLSEDEVNLVLSSVSDSADPDQYSSQRSSGLGTRTLGSSPQPADTLTDQRSHAGLQSRQVLLVELLERKNKNARQELRVAEVFVYDYDTTSTHRHLIDASTGVMIETQSVNSVHLPLNTAEQDFALQLIEQHPQLTQLLSAEYTEQFASALPALSELQNKVSIWQPAVSNHPVATTCQQRRCALVSIFTDNNYNFSVEPVIDLHSGQLYTGVLQ